MGFVVLLISPLALADAPTHPYPGSRQADIWLLAGQSNMAGSASLPDQLPPPDPRIMLFNMDNTWIVAQDPLHRIFEAAAPIIADFRYRDGISKERFQELRAQSKVRPLGGVGPGMPFARQVVAGINHPLGLVPNSPGGSGMSHWDPALRDQGDNSLYGALLNRVKMIGQPVKGLIWYQGEGEAMDNRAPADYEKALLNLFDSFRRDLAQPTLPILYVQIARATKSDAPDQDRAWENVREVQRHVAAKRQGIYMVSAVDLPQTDELHLNYDGQQRLGKRLGEVALSKVYGVAGHGQPIELDRISVVHGDGEWPEIHVRFNGVSGRLAAQGRPTGFSVRFPGRKGPNPQVFRVDFDPQDPAAVILRLRAPLKQPVELLYGAGCDPYVNIVDEKDMPLPAFGPIALDWTASPATGH
jgi:sialate O-acetylesterase